MPPRFTFRPLADDDLPLLAEWLARPHVAAWWGPPGSFDEIAREHREAMASPFVWPYLALLDGEPVGYAQAYDVMNADPEWWREETDPGARGIDQFLANEAHLGRGLGTEMIRQLVDRLFEDPLVTKVQADPSPHNARAIRAYEKAGFSRVGEIVTPDGAAVLLVRGRS